MHFCHKSFIKAISLHFFFSNGSGTAYASGASYTANAAATLYAQWAQAATIGAYISYTPTVGATTLTTSQTGYTSAQTYTPSSTTLWKIFNIDNNGVISIIPAGAACTITFRGDTGWNSVVSGDILSTIANNYINSTYAQSARHLGMPVAVVSDLTNYISMNASDKSIIDAHTDLNYSGGDTFTGGYYATINEGAGPNGITIRVVISVLELLASDGTLKPGVPPVNSVTAITSNSNGIVTQNNVSAAIRPIVTLKSTVQITGGAGTQSNPFTIGI